MSAVSQLAKYRDYSKFLSNHQRAVVFYGAEWCAACKDISPLYERIANRYQKNIGFSYCDIDKAKLEFPSLPIMVAFYNGKQIDFMEGSNIQEMKNLIKKCILYEPTSGDSDDLGIMNDEEEFNPGRPERPELSRHQEDDNRKKHKKRSTHSDAEKSQSSRKRDHREERSQEHRNEHRQDHRNDHRKDHRQNKKEKSLERDNYDDEEYVSIIDMMNKQ